MQIQGSKLPMAESRSSIARKAVLYARVSSKDQEQGYSIAAQQDLLRRYGSERNLTIEEFSDVETAKTVGRPGFNAMLSYLTKTPRLPRSAGRKDRPSLPQFPRPGHSR